MNHIPESERVAQLSREAAEDLKIIAKYGTRGVVKLADGTYRVVCTACQAQLPAVHNRGSAYIAARRDSNKQGCDKCKAKSTAPPAAP